MTPPGFDEPIELDDGSLVCSTHHLEICAKCCVDYTFMREVNSQDANSNEKKKKKQKNPAPVHPPLLDDEPSMQASSSASGIGAGPGAGFGGMSKQTQELLAKMKQPSAAEIEKMMRELGMDNGPKRGTGKVFPLRFVPKSKTDTPEKVFSGRRNHLKNTRFVLPKDKATGLIYVDGACLDNGTPNARAGWAFYHGIGPNNNNLVESARLEKKGPFKDDAAQTSNRAELRAVIAALRFRHWPGEKFHTLVFATDSEYVVEGATTWVQKWVEDKWMRRAAPGSRKKVEVKNRDLWEALLGEVEKLNGYGMDVQFWRIPREWNVIADAAAKEAAGKEGDAPEGFMDMMGLNV